MSNPCPQSTNAGHRILGCPTMTPDRHTVAGRRTSRLVVAVAVLGMLAAACSSSPDDERGGAPKAPATSDEPVSMAVNFSPQSLDPASGSWQLVQLGIGETLTRLDRKGQVQPWLAQSWTSSPDLKTWTFTLRDGVRFFDGAPMEADAVAGALQRSTTMNQSAKGLLNAVENGITARPPNTLQIELNAPDPVLYATVSQYNFVIYNPANLDQIASSPSLTGAFRPNEFTAGAGLQLVRNDAYWDSKAQVPSIRVLFQPDGNTRTNSLLSGQVDLAYQVPVQSIDAINARSGFTVQSVLSGYEDFLILNTRLPQFSDQNVRQALSQAVDREALAKLDGNKPAVGPVSPAYPFALITGGYAFNQAEAARKLDAAGWAAGSDGVRTKGADRLSFTLLFYNARPELPNMATVIQSQLKQIGVEVTLSQVPCCAAYRAPEFMAGLYANNTAPTGDAQSFFNPFYRGANMANFSSPAIEAALDRLATVTDSAQRSAMVQQVQGDLLAAAPYIFLTVPVFHTGLGPKLKSYEPYNSDYYVIDNQVAVIK